MNQTVLSFMHHFTSVLVVFLHAQMEGIFLQKQRDSLLIECLYLAYGQ